MTLPSINPAPPSAVEEVTVVRPAHIPVLSSALNPSNRPRSDTVLTASSSSSSSFPNLQTPQSPSILGVLGGYHVSSGSMENWGRKDSYGFDLNQAESWRSEVDTPELNAQSSWTSDNEGPTHTIHSELVIRTPTPTPPAQLAPAEGDEAPSLALPTDERFLLPDLAQASLLPAERPEYRRSRTALGAAVRKKLERSRTSFRGSSHVEDTEEQVLRPKKSRLLSLLAAPRSRSRSRSTSSLRSLLSNNASTSALRYAPSTLPSSVQDLSDAIVFGPTTNRSTGAAPHIGRHDLSLGTPDPVHSSDGQPSPRLGGSAVREGHVASASTLVLGTPIVREVVKRDLFGEVLPRELQLLVLKTLSDIHTGPIVGHSRWEGENGGRRELLKLTRVSKAWRSLCLDGQLWPMVHLAPFAGKLHPVTLHKLLSNARPFITSLSLQGMDSFSGVEIMKSLLAFSPEQDLCMSLPNLISLDLRGCKRLDSSDLLLLLSASPNLTTVNLKGLSAVSTAVVECIAKFAIRLETLDVSRCRNVSLGDLVVFLKSLSPDQMLSLKSFKVAGIKGYGSSASDFLELVAEKLVNVEILDIGGCDHVFDTDFHRFYNVLAKRDRPTKLRHLVLSSCSNLTSTVLFDLTNQIPEIRFLELANMSDLFRRREAEGENALAGLLKGCKKLERLDLEGSGLYGCVTDRIMEILVEECKGLVELRLGYAKAVTPEAMIRLIRGCPLLKVLEVDVRRSRSSSSLLTYYQNTQATNAVMRDFLRRRSSSMASISLIDCRAVTPQAYNAIAPSTRPRAGWLGYPALPFGYETSDPVASEITAKPVVKTFWSWRRVGVPQGWREELKKAEKREADEKDGKGKIKADIKRDEGEGRNRDRWWRPEEVDERGVCRIM